MPNPMEAVLSVVVFAMVADITGLNKAAPIARYRYMRNTPVKVENKGNRINAEV